jgi:hypothetical protein
MSSLITASPHMTVIIPRLASAITSAKLLRIATASQVNRPCLYMTAAAMI